MAASVEATREQVWWGEAPDEPEISLNVLEQVGVTDGSRGRSPHRKAKIDPMPQLSRQSPSGRIEAGSRLATPELPRVTHGRGEDITG